MGSTSQNPSLPRVLAWATNPVCALYRLRGPLSQLARDGHIDLMLTEVFDQSVYEKLSRAQIFVVQQRIDDTLRHVIKLNEPVFASSMKSTTIYWLFQAAPSSRLL